MRGIRVSPEAKVEIRDITAHSSQVFGASAAARYAELIKSGFRLLARTPDRPGVRSLGEGRHLFHLRLLTDTWASSRQGMSSCFDTMKSVCTSCTFFTTPWTFPHGSATFEAMKAWGAASNRLASGI